MSNILRVFVFLVGSTAIAIGSWLAYTAWQTSAGRSALQDALPAVVDRLTAVQAWARLHPETPDTTGATPPSLSAADTLVVVEDELTDVLDAFAAQDSTYTVTANPPLRYVTSFELGWFRRSVFGETGLIDSPAEARRWQDVICGGQTILVRQRSASKPQLTGDRTFKPGHVAYTLVVLGGDPLQAQWAVEGRVENDPSVQVTYQADRQSDQPSAFDIMEDLNTDLWANTRRQIDERIKAIMPDHDS